MEKCIVSKVKEGIHKERKYYAREAGGWKTMLPFQMLENSCPGGSGKGWICLERSKASDKERIGETKWDLGNKSRMVIKPQKVRLKTLPSKSIGLECQRPLPGFSQVVATERSKAYVHRKLAIAQQQTSSAGICCEYAICCACPFYRC